MRELSIIRIHAAAPRKPDPGQACNGCGVCCLAEPCPLGMLVSLRAHGACAALRWDEGRYRCGLMRGAAARWVGRWIAAGAGCDSSAQIEDHRTADADDAAGSGGLGCGNGTLPPIVTPTLPCPIGTPMPTPTPTELHAASPAETAAPASMARIKE